MPERPLHSAPADPCSVVIAWGPGKYTFRHRWQAAAFRYLARRWSGWTSWVVLDERERAQSLKPLPAKKNR